MSGEEARACECDERDQRVLSGQEARACERDGRDQRVLSGQEAAVDGRERAAELAARVAWSRLAEPGDPVAARLVAGVGPVRAWAAVRERSGGVLERFRPRLAGLDVEADLADTRECGARIVVPGDAEWPDGLDDLEAPPFCLWVRGPLRLAEACERSVAVVGARAGTHYGEALAAEMGAGLAERGITVVSGAAFGIDAAAHRGALAVDGPTIAVLASGVDRPYPAAHHRLIGHIADRGLVVSEVPPGSAALRHRFLLRNRLIATMSRGTVVVEAGIRSGSRNTAGTAAEHHRPVGAMPGAVTSVASVGCHEMIRSGLAALVTNAAEAAELVGAIGELAPEREVPVRVGDGLPETDRRVLEALPGRGVLDVEAVAARAGVSVRAAQSGLGRLELEGLAGRRDAGWVRVTARRAG